MSTTATPLERSRFLASGDEAGTAPEDRAFRPDVEGLRATSVRLVVVFPADGRQLQAATTSAYGMAQRELVVEAMGGRGIDVLPWFCSQDRTR